MNLLDEKKKNIIILAEIGALLHDLGKLSEKFIIEKSSDGQKDKNWHHVQIVNYDADKMNIAEAKNVKNMLSHLQIDSTITILDLMEGHHEKEWNENGIKDYSNNGSPHFLIKLLCASDKFDSEEDKGKVIESGQQLKDNTWISNAFGHEHIKITLSDLEKDRINLYKLLIDELKGIPISDIEKHKDDLYSGLKKILNTSLGETRRSANDVTIWQHSYMTATIFKALINHYFRDDDFKKDVDLLEGSYTDGWKWDSDIKDIIKNKNPFKILSVTWDFFAFISQSHKIPDVTGRIKILKEIKDKMRKKIEIEIMLGNCIYEDDNELHFLIPASFTDISYIKEEIYEILNEKVEGIINPFIFISEKESSLKELLNKSLKNEKNISNKFVSQWISKWVGDNSSKYVCSICGKGYYSKDSDEEICDICNRIRNRGRKTDGNQMNDDQTIFLDEIAWNKNYYENICLFTLNFNLNNWLNGNNIQNLFVKKLLNIEKLSENKGIFKDMINPEIGPLISKRKTLAEENIENISKNIEHELKKFDIVGDEKKILDEIINNIKYMTSDEINRKIDDILQNILENYEFIKISEKFNGNNLENFKTPSPSRLMRVWNDTRDFFICLNSTFSDSSLTIKRNILHVNGISSLKNPPITNFPYELKIKSNSGEIDAEGYFQINKLHIVTPHVNTFIIENDSLRIEITDNIWKPPEKEFTATSDGFREYKTFRTISISPNMFMFIAPAHKTEEILNIVKKEYSKIFGKAYGKLPLNISLIYFSRKTPMYAVFDSAKRFLDHIFDQEVTIPIQKVIENKNKILLETGIGQIVIPTSLGDGAPDCYHPYIQVENGENCININNNRMKYALSLKKDEKIKIHPSHFDFIFLDSNIRRFDISYENRKRPHTLFESGPRPYSLEEINLFTMIWDILKERCDNTQLNNFESLLISKIKEWNLNSIQDLKNKEFSELLKSSIDNILRIKDKDDDGYANKIIYDSVMSGMFFDMKELYHTILKEKLGGNRNE